MPEAEFKSTHPKSKGNFLPFGLCPIVFQKNSDVKLEGVCVNSFLYARQRMLPKVGVS